MTIENTPDGVLAQGRTVDDAFSALAKTFGSIMQVSDPYDSPETWRSTRSARCEHNWPPDLGEPDACCTTCGLDYAEYEE